MARGRKATAGEKTGHRKAPGEIESIVESLPPVETSLATREPPDDLPAAAGDAWRICIAEMAGNRHVREPDLLLLRGYVMAIHVHEEATASILKHGALMAVYAQDLITGEIVKDSKGDPVVVGMKPNPAVKVRNDAATQIRYFSDILGLNPLARIRQNLAEIAGANGMLDIRDRLVSELSKGR